MRWLDSLLRSTGSAFSIGNLVKRLGLLFLFGFVLGMTKLISGLDKAGSTGSGLLGYINAVTDSMKYGLGVGHATVWDFIIHARSFIEGHAYGTIFFSAVFFICIIGFWYQPVSLFVNIFDFKGAEDTHNKSGQATGVIFRGIYTFIVVLIISCVVFYSGISESIAGGGSEFVNDDINTNSTQSPQSQDVVANNITNSLNLLGVST